MISEDDAWEEAVDENGNLYFVNKISGKSNIDLQREKRNEELRQQMTEEYAAKEKRSNLLRTHFSPSINVAALVKGVSLLDGVKTEDNSEFSEETKAHMQKNDEDLAFFW
jgi:hypothetical protein